MAARLKHIALTSEDPAKTAEFYKSAFGLTELRRVPADTGAEGVWLSDGYIYFAIVKFGNERNPNMGRGPTTVPGFHHIGFLVDDLEQACNDVEAADGKSYPGMDDQKWFRFYMGPDALMVDIRSRGHGWDEIIKKKMQLYELTPAPVGNK